jgi:hypothetical protein
MRNNKKKVEKFNKPLNSRFTLPFPGRNKTM